MGTAAKGIVAQPGVQRPEVLVGGLQFLQLFLKVPQNRSFRLLQVLTIRVVAPDVLPFCLEQEAA